MDGIVRRDGVDFTRGLCGDNGIMPDYGENLGTLGVEIINPRQQAAESMMQVGIGSLGDRPSPNYGNLPNKYKGPLGNNPNYLGEPIHNLSFNINN